MNESASPRATPHASVRTPRVPQLWVIVGATGTGKTALSLELAERLREQQGVTAEIVNADAMQFYRGMDIGTAKLASAERRGIAHHLFDVLAVTEEATVAWYQPLARTTIGEIHRRGHDAILVGGSGLYVSSAIYDFHFPPRDEQLRATLEAQLENDGSQALLAQLRELDAVAAASVDARNPRRLVRALEIALLGGVAQTQLPDKPPLWYPHTHLIGVHCDRATLTLRLRARVEEMWAAGLLDEVQQLLPLGLERGKTASRAIGYAQALAQLRGELTESEALERTNILTRRYARRQVSWFHRYPGVQWLTEPAASHIQLPANPAELPGSE